MTLAERLRKLPLSFFGKRDLADLTSTIMADCEVLEKDCSHFIPGLFGSLISTVLIALSLFAFDGRMALAALWVIPVSAAIVVGSYRVQDKVQRCGHGAGNTKEKYPLTTSQMKSTIL